MGLGFYVTLPEPLPLRQTISINLSAITELSDTTEIGASERKELAQAPEQEPQQKKIIHTPGTEQPFDYNVFVAEQQRLLKEIDKISQEIKEIERIGFLSLMDIKPAYRQYQEYWQNYVSQFGTQNYPGVLLDKNLSGSLELDISIDQQGVVRDINVLSSSGSVDIDNAAIEIAMLASPYAPLPQGIAKDIDILHIIRIWEFNNRVLTSRSRK